MGKEELSQIFYLNQEVKMWQKELNDLKSKSLISGQRMNGMPHAKEIADKTADIAARTVEIERIISGKLAEIQLQRKNIIEYITGVEDSLMRQILFYRHVSLMSWQAVASHIGGGNTADGVRVAYKRFFDKK